MRFFWRLPLGQMNILYIHKIMYTVGHKIGGSRFFALQSAQLLKTSFYCNVVSAPFSRCDTVFRVFLWQTPGGLEYLYLALTKLIWHTCWFVVHHPSIPDICHMWCRCQIFQPGVKNQRIDIFYVFWEIQLWRVFGVKFWDEIVLVWTKWEISGLHPSTHVTDVLVQ